MNKYNILIAGSTYKELQKQLQEYEINIGGIPVRNFLIANATFQDASDPLDLRVKRIVLHIAGDFDSSPEGLGGEVNLENQLMYSNNEYLLMQKQLDQLVKSYNETLTIGLKEIHACHLVADCVDLVNSKISRGQSN